MTTVPVAAADDLPDDFPPDPEEILPGYCYAIHPGSIPPIAIYRCDPEPEP